MLIVINMFDKLLSVQNISVDYTSNSFLFPWEKNLKFLNAWKKGKILSNENNK